MTRIFGLDDKAKSFEFKCDCCSEIHRGSPSFAYDKPVFYFDVPEEEREDRTFLTSDLCVIDDKIFLIRAILEIPIHGVEEPFTWGIWVSQSEENFLRYQDTYDDDQSGITTFGWLAATMPGYNERDEEGLLVNLKTNVMWQAPGDRPIVELQDCDHPLYRDQRDGISWERAVELAQLTMHGPGDETADAD